MRDGKRSGLLRKVERKFPDQNDRRVHKNRKSPVLKFAREIAADPRVRTQERPMAFRPTARDVGEDWQNRQFIIVIPKNQRIVPEQNQTKKSDEQARRRKSRRRSAIPLTVLVLTRSDARILWRSGYHARGPGVWTRTEGRPTSTTGLPSVMTRTLFSIPCARAQASKRCGGSCSGS